MLDDCAFLSAISKKFLERLVHIDRTLRYTAQDALQHPWITRLKQNRIPQNLVDQMQAMDHEKQLRRKFNLVHFLSIQKLYLKSQSQSDNHLQSDYTDQNTDNADQGLKRILDEIGTSTYKQKLLRFSKRIDRWHDEQSKLNSGIFEEDRDFVELDHSPSKFSNLPADHSSLDDFLLGNANNQTSQSHMIDSTAKDNAYEDEQ